MIACTRAGSVPKVGGISAASSRPSRPLVPAPTKMIRPPRRSTCVMMSTPTAIRSFSRWTAASILRSSFNMASTMSAEESLSMARVDGLMASVGRPCHFERGVMLDRPYEPGAHTIIRGASVIDLYLDHLRVERRLADHTLESYQRDLRALAAFAAETCARARGARPRPPSRRSSGSRWRAGFRRGRWRDRSPRFGASSAFWCSTAGCRRARPTTCRGRAPGRRCRSFSRSRKSTRSSPSRTSRRPAASAIAR